MGWRAPEASCLGTSVARPGNTTLRDRRFLPSLRPVNLDSWDLERFPRALGSRCRRTCLWKLVCSAGQMEESYGDREELPDRGRGQGQDQVYAEGTAGPEGGALGERWKLGSQGSPAPLQWVAPIPGSFSPGLSGSPPAPRWDTGSVASGLWAELLCVATLLLLSQEA